MSKVKVISLDGASRFPLERYGCSDSGNSFYKSLLVEEVNSRVTC